MSGSTHLARIADLTTTRQCARLEGMKKELLYDLYWNSDIAYLYSPFYYSPEWRETDKAPAVIVGDAAFALSDEYMDNFGYMVYDWAEYTATIGLKIEWTQSSLKTRGTEAEARAAFQSWLSSVNRVRAKAAASYMEALRSLPDAQEYLDDAKRVMEWAETCVESTRNAYLECLRTE